MRKNTCVFCGSAADTREHVFARQFYDSPLPSNVPTVPSCSTCNKGFEPDEKYLMYLIDYLKSIEQNDGDFTRDRAHSEFMHRDSLENRMMEHIKIDYLGKPYFEIENSRVTRVVQKIAKCFFFYRDRDGVIVDDDSLLTSWDMLSQMNASTIRDLEDNDFVVLQEGTVRYASTQNTLLFVLSDFFYAFVSIIPNAGSTAIIEELTS